jgi:hypothetical protein
MDKEARKRLLEFLGALPEHMRRKLESLKAEALRIVERSDFLWYLFLTGFASMGASRGYQGLISDEANYNRITFEALSALSPGDRRGALEAALRRAKIRWPARKATWLAYNHALILESGGLTAVQVEAQAQRGTEAKIAFLKRFKGIGDKYGRNIWMDIYDPDFRHTIAIDERIRTVSRALGVGDLSYAEHEAVYQGIARDAGLEPWELDRILYWYNAEALKAIESTRPITSA